MIKKTVGLTKRNLFVTLALLMALGLVVGFEKQQSAAPQTPKPNTSVANNANNGPARYVAEPGERPGEEGNRLLQMDEYWQARVTYPTGKFDLKWLQNAASQDRANVRAGVPSGQVIYNRQNSQAPLALSPNSWTSIGPKPQDSNTCQAPCFTFGRVAGRTNDIVIDPVSPTIAYMAADGGGVWKTTNCCTAATLWSPTTDDPLISTLAIDDLSIDRNNHNVYAGTGDLSFGSFSFGSSGILKSADLGATWTVKGADVFGPYYPEPAGKFPQYNSVGKVEPDPRNSNTLIAGAKTGVYFSYNGGDAWTGPCLPDLFPAQRQDVTALLVRSNINNTATDLYVAVGTRGFSTTVQYNLAENGANGIYKTTVPTLGCPATWNLLSRPNNGWPVGSGSGVPVYLPGGNPLGRIDMAMAPSDPNVLYAQVQAIVPGVSGGLQRGGQMGLWRTTDAGVSWTQQSTAATLNADMCPSSLVGGDYPQNWYDQGVAVDPNNPNTIYMDTFDIWQSTDGGVSFRDVTCGYGSLDVPAQVHVDQHALAFAPGSSSTLMAGSDGGTYVTLNANTAQPVFNQVNNTVSTIEFYSGDITQNFATSAAPMANAGAQDNGSSIWDSDPTLLWKQRLGGDGMFARIEPVVGQRWYFESQNGGLNVSTGGPYGALVSAKGGWGSDRLSFVFPYEIYKNDCPPTGCTHLIAGSNRVWETTQGGVPATSWYANSPDLTKGALADRSFINQLSYAVSISTTAIVGANDGNVQYGFGLGQGTANTAVWVNVTGSNLVLPNRPILDVATDAANPLVGYAAVGGFNENTPATPGHVFQVTCTANCGAFNWVDKTGNLPNIPVDAIIVNPRFRQQVFAGTDWGVYFTDNIDAPSPVWNRFNVGMPNVMVWDFQIDLGNTALAAFTRSRGAFVYPLTNAPIGTPLPTFTGTPPTATRTNTPQNTFTPTATGTRTNSPTSTITPTPLGCGQSVPLVEGFESGTLGVFTETTLIGNTHWTAQTTAANTGSWSAFALDPDESTPSDQQLTLRNPVAVPSNTTQASLRFSHRYSFEQSSGTTYDGGVLELSTNGGATWNDAGPNITSGGYTGVITATGGNPLANRPAWVSQSPGYPNFYGTTVNLLPFAGQSVKFRYRLGSDLNTGAPGWWIDDVYVLIAEPCPATFTPTRTNTPLVTLTPTFTATATATATPPSCGPNSNYTYAQATGTIVPGTALVPGSQCNGCYVDLNLPFSYSFYGQSRTYIAAYSGGDMAFYCCNSNDSNTCLPANYPSLENVIFAHWDSLDMSSPGACAGGCGIYISTTGLPPNRIYNIEWRAKRLGLPGDVNFEVRLYEGQSRFDLVYGAVAGNGSSATVGAQKDNGSQLYTQYQCNNGGLTPGLQLTFTQSPCPSDTLIGHVTWQGRPSQPNPLQQLPITLTLKSATTEVNYPVQITDPSGFFTVPTGSLLPGPYNYRVKDPKYLANSGSVVIAPGTNRQEMGLMRAGDCNDDNLDNVSDFNIMKTTFGRQIGEPGYDDRADFTGDQLVNIADFNLLKLNFGTGGAPPVRPGK